MLFIYSSCDLIYFYHKKVVEIIFDNEIKIFLFSNQFLFLKKMYMCVHYWNDFKLKI